MTPITHHQLILLEKAVPYVEKKDIQSYLDLKRILSEKNSGYRVIFRKKFSLYYRLNSAGLTEEFHNAYFQHLFRLEGADITDDTYLTIIKDLYFFPRRQGDKALQCSFVSKMIAIHDETRPIFDVHVKNFFGIGVPTLGSVDFRAAGFVANIKLLREIYASWEQDPHFLAIRNRLLTEFSDLEGCLPCRLADFLVWTVGRKKIAA